jgi:hypothetical protein
MIFGFAVVLAALVVPTGDTAQQAAPPTRQPRTYVRAGFVLLNQAEGVSDCPYLCNPLGGTSNAITFGVGVRANDRFSVSGDLTVAANLEMEQSARASQGTYLYDTRYREILLAGSARWHLPMGAASTFEPVVGGGMSLGRVNRSVQLARIFPPGSERLPDVSTFRHDPLVVAGVDATIPVSASVALVPTVRFYWLWRSGEGGGTAPPEHGLGSRIITFGASVQFGGRRPG